MVKRDFSIDFWPIIFPLQLIYSEIFFYPKYLVLTFSIDVDSALSNDIYPVTFGKHSVTVNLHSK